MKRSLTLIKILLIIFLFLGKTICGCDPFISELPKGEPSLHTEEEAGINGLIFVSLYASMLFFDVCMDEFGFYEWLNL